MTTIKEFIHWLKEFPEDTIVKVAFQQAHEHGSDFFFNDIDVEKSNIGYGWRYMNYTDNEYIKQDDEIYNKKVLYLGEVE